jgi:hypothetical protein
MRAVADNNYPLGFTQKSFSKGRQFDIQGIYHSLGIPDFANPAGPPESQAVLKLKRGD